MLWTALNAAVAPIFALLKFPWFTTLNLANYKFKKRLLSGFNFEFANSLCHLKD